MDAKGLQAWADVAFRKWCAKRGIDPATGTVVGRFAHTWARGDEALPLPEGQQKM